MNLHEEKEKYSEKFFTALEKDLAESGSKESAQIFFRRTLKNAAFAGLFTFLALVLFLDDIVAGLIVAGLFFAVILVFLLYRPRQKKKQKAMEIEKDLPFFLMSLGVQLNVGVPLKNALEKGAEKERNALGKELRSAMKKIDSGGVSLPAALLSLGKKTDSLMLKRALSQVAGIYRQGKQAQTETLRSLAREQLSIQKAQGREFNGKIAFYSLLFIAVSTVFPSLFQTFVMVGSGFMDLDFTALEVIFIVTVLFPLFDIAVLLYIRSKTPAFLR
ncbi:MAG: type II secretion system F family protein [Candidatus Diapherotrites archaeon]|nr:type II secretion system F family protein [Candidatus Diapherotrites archaeon]